MHPQLTLPQHWDTVAADIKAARAAELRAWVESFSPDTIRAANLARTRMRAMLRDTPYKLIRFSGLQAIPDERRVLKPSSAWMLFCKDRLKDGDLDGKLTERTSAISAEYRALSEEQLKVWFPPPRLSTLVFCRFCGSISCHNTTNHTITTQHALTTIYSHTRSAQLPNRRATRA